MSESLVIPCPHCNGLNRIPGERLGDAPKCGRCKQPVLLNKPFDLKQGDYASQIKSDLPLLVDVWADWCGPCKSFAPVFEQAAGQQASAGWQNWTVRLTSSCRRSWGFVRFPV